MGDGSEQTLDRVLVSEKSFVLLVSMMVARG